MGDIAVPPTACPDDLQTAVNMLEQEPRNLLLSHKVAWPIIATIGELGYSTTPDLADLYNDLADVRAMAPTELNFADGSRHFTQATTKLHAIRLAHAVEDAKQIRKHRVERLHGEASSTQELITSGTREALEKAYANLNHGVVPPIKHQGSDHYLGLQYKECQKGQIGWFSDKQIISKLPDIQGTSTRKEEKKKADGTYEVTDSESREPPQTWNAWKEQTLVFRTSLLMCTAASSQHGNIQISKDELDSFYDFLEGPEFGSHPSYRVPLTRLRSTEREAWRRICLKVHERTPLTQALKEVRADYLFWTPLLMADSGAGFTATGEGKGKGKRGKGDGKGKRSPWTPPRRRSRSDRQPPQPKAKGKGRQTWVKSDSTGKEYCWAYNRGWCQGSCNRLHRCCHKLQSGQACHGKHPASGCTRY